MMFATAPDGGVEALSDVERETIMSDIDRWFSEHRQAGRIVSGERLAGVATATTVRRSGQQPIVIDGPFAETKEHISGYVIIDVVDLEEALSLAISWPALLAGEAVEIRPVAR